MQPVLHSNHNDFDEEGEEEMMNNQQTPIEVPEDMEDDFFEAND